MKIRYTFDVMFPGEDYKWAMELHVKLQGALAEVLQEEGLTTDGLKPRRLDPVDPTAPAREEQAGTKNLMEWTQAAVDKRDKR